MAPGDCSDNRESPKNHFRAPDSWQRFLRSSSAARLAARAQSSTGVTKKLETSCVRPHGNTVPRWGIDLATGPPCAGGAITPSNAMQVDRPAGSLQHDPKSGCPITTLAHRPAPNSLYVAVLRPPTCPRKRQTAPSFAMSHSPLVHHPPPSRWGVSGTKTARTQWYQLVRVHAIRPRRLSWPSGPRRWCARHHPARSQQVAASKENASMHSSCVSGQAL